MPSTHHHPQPEAGLRVERIPGRPVHRDDGGRIALPLWLLRDGRHLGDAELMLTRAEAAELHEQLGTALAQDEAGAR